MKDFSLMCTSSMLLRLIMEIDIIKYFNAYLDYFFIFTHQQTLQYKLNDFNQYTIVY